MANHLIARPPMPGYARLRFVSSERNWLSELIRWRTMGEVSHVENVLRDGSIIGAYGDGVKQIPGDTDLGYTTQRFVDILMTQDSLDRWESYLKSRIGRPYDYSAIAGFLVHANWRHRRAFICSMLSTLSLRPPGTFPRPLAVPAHEVSPRDLLLTLSAHPAAKIGQLERLNP